MSSSAEPKPEPVLSRGSDREFIRSTLDLKLLPPYSRWRLTASKKGIERTIKFKTFKAAWEFMNRVAAEAKTSKHHPEWANIYNTVFVRWTTHSPEGLSEKDVRMALFCDEHAGELGEVISDTPESDSRGNEDLNGILGSLKETAGDCCAPGKK